MPTGSPRTGKIPNENPNTPPPPKDDAAFRASGFQGLGLRGLVLQAFFPLHLCDVLVSDSGLGVPT